MVELVLGQIGSKGPEICDDHPTGGGRQTIEQHVGHRTLPLFGEERIRGTGGCLQLGGRVVLNR